MFGFLEQMLGQYGYLVLFVGTFLEGETILIIAGALAAQGVLNIHGAILSALLGTMLGDNCYFLLGRYKGQWLIDRKPQWKPSVAKVQAFLDRNSTWLILTFRFMYGVRNITSLAVGMSHVKTHTFVILNAIGATIWALSFGWGGYFLGDQLKDYIEKAKDTQLLILAAAVLAILLFWKIRSRRIREATARQNAKDEAAAANPAENANSNQG